MEKGWWVRHPDYFEREKNALNGLGYKWEIDEVAFDEGRLVINVVYPHGNGSINLNASYPDSFPYFMPTVSSADIHLEHHQHPIGHELCLLADVGSKWDPANDTLAILIQKQLPEVLRANDANGDINHAVLEEHVSEPISAFIHYLKPGIIIHPGWHPPEGIDCGKLMLTERDHMPKASSEQRLPTFAVVNRVRDINDKDLAVFPEAKKLPYNKPLIGFWFRIHERPSPSDAKDIKQFVAKNIPEAIARKLPLSKNKKYVIAVTYQDELSWGNQHESDWLFFSVFSQGKPVAGRPAGFKMQPIIAESGEKNTLLARTPELFPLSGKRVLIIGLGSLGSPLVVELARAGVGTLEICDYDSLQVGNSVRWALGWGAAGFYKTQALQHFLTANHPHTNIEIIHLRLGQTPVAEGVPGAGMSFDANILEKAISKADLVIDASAEYRVHHFLADTCQMLKKSYLWLSTTHGALGGRIGRIIPNNGQGCFHCAMRHISDKNFVRPPEKEGVPLQAPGCAALSFTGAGIDATTIALQASRLAIATLCKGHEDAYPDFDWNLSVISLRDMTGNSILHTDVYPLNPHPDCQCQQ